MALEYFCLLKSNLSVAFEYDPTYKPKFLLKPALKFPWGFSWHMLLAYYVKLCSWVGYVRWNLYMEKGRHWKGKQTKKKEKLMAMISPLFEVKMHAKLFCLKHECMQAIMFLIWHWWPNLLLWAYLMQNLVEMQVYTLGIRESNCTTEMILTPCLLYSNIHSFLHKAFISNFFSSATLVL